MYEDLSDLFTANFPNNILYRIVRLNESQDVSDRLQNQKNQSQIAQTLAENLLKQYSCPQKITKKNNAAPIWPKGFLGSITHSNNMVGAVLSKTSEFEYLGFDCEKILTEDRALRLARKVLNDDEKKIFQTQDFESFGNYVTTVFSAKEAFYKAMLNLQNRLTYENTTVRFDHIDSKFKKFEVHFEEKNHITSLQGQAFYYDSFVFTLCFVKIQTHPERNYDRSF